MNIYSKCPSCGEKLQATLDHSYVFAAAVSVMLTLPFISKWATGDGRELMPIGAASVLFIGVIFYNRVIPKPRKWWMTTTEPYLVPCLKAFIVINYTFLILALFYR